MRRPCRGPCTVQRRARCGVGDNDTEAAVRELSVVGVRVELPTNQPIVLLREVDGDRYLPIWIGAVEATAIAPRTSARATPARPRRGTRRRSTTWR